ncbi:TRAF family member-associated NF-kappa-B activator isoform X2 [Amia ocellicauda]|uniref:TRAF family member-associated NF-kappa-B activator isoform X2 n=1 Tax=Amia ocellicauda TaxID=2972642 RepID=UPI003464969C
MERKMADQLNKAFDAYRQASIEKDSVKKELQQKTDAYEQHIHELHQQIHDHKQLIVQLKTQLNMAGNSSKGMGKDCELPLECKDDVLPTLRKHEPEALTPCDLHENPRLREKHLMLKENMKTAELVVAQAVPFSLPGMTAEESKEVLEAFQELQGKFLEIRSLTRKQKDHLNRLCTGEGNAAEEPEFSMPIQCTDITVEQAEGPLTSATKSDSDKELSSASITSRGVSPDDGDYEKSFSKLSIKFPPTDSDYDFLNSAPERKDFALGTKDHVFTSSLPKVTVKQTLEFPTEYTFTETQTASPSIMMHKGVRGPQQPDWSPEACEDQAQAACADPEQNKSPENCAFCDAILPEGTFYRHLNSHFQNKASNGF